MPKSHTSATRERQDSCATPLKRGKKESGNTDPVLRLEGRSWTGSPRHGLEQSPAGPCVNHGSLLCDRSYIGISPDSGSCCRARPRLLSAICNNKIQSVNHVVWIVGTAGRGVSECSMATWRYVWRTACRNSTTHLRRCSVCRDISHPLQHTTVG